jgi:hypothetical protein
MDSLDSRHDARYAWPSGKKKATIDGGLFQNVVVVVFYFSREDHVALGPACEALAVQRCGSIGSES